MGFDAVQNLASKSLPKISVNECGSNVEPCIQSPILRSKALKVNAKPRGTAIRILQSLFQLLVNHKRITGSWNLQFRVYSDALNNAFAFDNRSRWHRWHRHFHPKSNSRLFIYQNHHCRCFCCKLSRKWRLASRAHSLYTRHLAPSLKILRYGLSVAWF